MSPLNPGFEKEMILDILAQGGKGAFSKQP
jgi:hypothetical protein